MNTLQVITERVPVATKVGRFRRTTAAVIVIWCGHIIWIPAGFLFDGASVPFFLWWWVHPWDWWVILAACVHDYTYRYRMFTRKECDHIFRLLLIHKARQSRWRWLAYRRMVKARIMWKAVRAFGDNAVGDDW